MFEIAKYHLILKVESPITFNTFPGFHIRNALVKCFTDYCRNENRKKDGKVMNCHGCKFLNKCVYHSLNLPVEEPLAAPLPMPFSLNVDQMIIGKYEEGEMCFEMNLFGKAIQYSDHFKKAFSDIGSNYGIGDKNKEGKQGFFKVVEMSLSEKTTSESELEKIFSEKESLILKFARLKLSDKNMEIPVKLPFNSFMEMLIRRISDLELNYGNGECSISHISHNEHTIEDYSSFAKCNYKYTGSGKGHFFLNGRVEYKGNLGNYINLITLGSIIGIGRFTAYGFGNYSIEYE